MAQGKLDEAVLALNEEETLRTDPLAVFLVANCYYNLGMRERATALLEIGGREWVADSNGQ